MEVPLISLKGTRLNLTAWFFFVFHALICISCGAGSYKNSLLKIVFVRQILLPFPQLLYFCKTKIHWAEIHLCFFKLCKKDFCICTFCVSMQCWILRAHKVCSTVYSSLSGSQSNLCSVLQIKSILHFCSFPPNHLDALSHGVVPASSVTWWTVFMPAPRAETSSIKLHSGTDTLLPGKFVWRGTRATLVADLFVLH